MLEDQIQALGAIWRDPGSRELVRDGAFSLMKLVLFDDIGSGADLVRTVLKFHTPTVLYWDKMWRYMNGVFRDPADQVKMAEKFEPYEPQYQAFVKRQMNMINEMNDDQKIDYFAMLTRSFLYSDMEQSLYLKLAKFLSMCTPGELEFLQGVNYEDKIANSMMSASLYQYGLLMLEYQQDGRALFVLSDFGKALKQNSLNFDDGVSGHRRLVSYDSMSPAELQGFATNDDIEKLFQNQELILDGGSACGLPWE